MKKATQVVFQPALTDWGWVSGIAIVDSGQPPNTIDESPHGGYGAGNLLMHAKLENARRIYTGDAVKFYANTLKIRFK